jgi:alcohol dehydrogenase
MGLIVAQVVRTTGALVTVFGKHPRKLTIARELGFPTAIAADHLASGERFEIVVDVTGRAEGLTRALELVRPRGVVVLKSTFHGECAATLWPAVVNEVTLVGSRCGPFEPAIDLLARGVVEVAPLVSRTLPLDEFEAAFAAAQRELKVLFRM